MSRVIKFRDERSRTNIKGNMEKNKIRGEGIKRRVSRVEFSNWRRKMNLFFHL